MQDNQVSSYLVMMCSYMLHRFSEVDNLLTACMVAAFAAHAQSASGGGSVTIVWTSLHRPN